MQLIQAETDQDLTDIRAALKAHQMALHDRAAEMERGNVFMTEEFCKKAANDLRYRADRMGVLISSLEANQ